MTERWDGHDEAYLLVSEAELFFENREERGAHVPSRMDQCVDQNHDEEAVTEKVDAPITLLWNVFFYVRSP